VASLRRIVAVGLIAGLFFAVAGPVIGQDALVIQDGTQSILKVETVEGGAAVISGPGAAAGPSGMPPGAKPPEGGPPGRRGPPGMEPPKPGEPPKPDGEKGKPGEKKEPTAVQRPTKPPSPPDPNELKVKPNKDGKLSFNFKNQPWEGVLQWLADVSGMSLDWQELPGDYLNLSTPPGQSFTIPEARNLINRHLLARGFTLLVDGNTLTVASVGKLNPAMVPRVRPEELAELAKREPYAFVKVSFPLEWMLAETAVEELKPMLSPNHKLIALKATNRLEAMDAAINLQQVQEVLAKEQSLQTQEGLVRKFVLKHTKASDVCDQLKELLGVESKPGAARRARPAERGSDDARRMAMMGNPGMPQQPMQQPQPQPGQPGMPGGPPKPKLEVSLTPNEHDNSIIAVAPPDRMILIAQAIKAIDVASNEGQSLLGTAHRWQVYRLASIEPDALIQTLEDIGNLDPGTRLQADKKNRAIVAYAPLADHVQILSLVERLDGSARKFYVIPLRRLEADYVAGTIEFMMTGERGDKKQQQRSRYYYPYDFGGSSQKQEETADRFRVEPDIERNRLILWANPIELQDVQGLLEKLGENTGAGDSPTIRVLELAPGKETDDLLERIRRHWPSVGPNPLILPPPEPPKEPEKEKPAATPLKKDLPPSRRTAAAEMPPVPELGRSEGTTTVAVALAPPDTEPSAEPPKSTPAGEAAKTAPPAELPPPTRVGPPRVGPPPKAASPDGPPLPVTITRTPDGKLMITSLDTRALDRLEDLVSQLSPAYKTDYEIFRLKYALASSVATVLKEIFKEGGGQRIPLWMQIEYGMGDSSEKERGRLSKRRALKIVSEIDTNSILVQGADASQLKTIKELVAFYDKPEPPDAQSVHKTEKFVLRWTKAEVIADTLKDVYRDLLSPKDRALAGQQPRPERSFIITFDDSGGGESQKRPRFQGLLSIGVDKVSNTLIVSAPPYLLQEVGKLITELDEAAQPVESVSVVKIGPGVSSQSIEAAVSKLLGNGTSGGAGRTRPGMGQPGQPGQPGDHQRNQSGDQGNRRGRRGG
jgi:type II secretory pathway component GspD/PulD (secretin)